MKNIYLIPTENYLSKLATYKGGGFFISDSPMNIGYLGLKANNVDGWSNVWKPVELYITSDEEIKLNDYVTDEESLFKVISNNYQTLRVTDKGNNLIKLHESRVKKIILTTDPDLIKEGVQEIDDDFINWFVKNPTCEYVKVIRNKKLSHKSIWDVEKGDLVFNNHGFGGIIQELTEDVRVHILSENGEGYMEVASTSDNGKDTLIICGYKVYNYTDYKIIIPQEEPKQETRVFGTRNDKTFWSDKPIQDGHPDKQENNKFLEKDTIIAWNESINFLENYKTNEIVDVIDSNGKIDLEASKILKRISELNREKELLFHKLLEICKEEK